MWSVVLAGVFGIAGTFLGSWWNQRKEAQRRTEDRQREKETRWLIRRQETYSELLHRSRIAHRKAGLVALRDKVGESQVPSLKEFEDSMMDVYESVAMALLIASPATYPHVERVQGFHIESIDLALDKDWEDRDSVFRLIHNRLIAAMREELEVEPGALAASTAHLPTEEVEAFDAAMGARYESRRR